LRERRPRRRAPQAAAPAFGGTRFDIRPFLRGVRAVNMREFLSGLEARDVKIWKEGDKLRVRAPEGALTEVDREHLRVHRDALLRFFAAPNEGPQTVIAARDANEPVTYPLSSSQRRLWLLEQLAPGPRYHIHLRIAWNGD